MNIFAGPLGHLSFRNKTLKRLRQLNMFFLSIVLIFSFLFFLLSYFDILVPGTLFSKNNFSLGNEKSIGMISSNGGTGSGFLIGTNTWVTAHHVVSDLALNETCEILLDRAESKEKLELRLKKFSEEFDIAVLEAVQIPQNKVSVPYVIGSFAETSIGDEVSITGYPNEIFCFARTQISNSSMPDHDDLFLMSGAAWPGSSGGPIIHSKTGKVIGVLVGGFENQYKGLVVGVKVEKLNLLLQQ
jgi:hypothetical protein